MFALEAALGLRGALRIAGGNSDGLALLPTRPDAVWRSCAAALICWPAYMALRLMVHAEATPDLDVGTLIAIETCAFVIAWFGFALASAPIANALGAGPLWPRFLAAWNWTNVVQYLFVLAGEMPGWLGLPRGIAVFAAVIALVGAISVEWQAARLALGLRGGQAALVVLADIALSLLVRGVADGMLASAAAPG